MKKTMKGDIDYLCNLIEKKNKEIERLNNVIAQIEGAIYNDQITGIEARITIQEILDKENN